MPKTDPPKPGGLSTMFGSWKQDNHSLSKTYQFRCLESLNAFCISLLTNDHSQDTQLSAVELRPTCAVQVNIYSKTTWDRNETIRLIESIESSYQENNDIPAKRHSWFRFKNPG
jgi:hypothetical protein